MSTLYKKRSLASANAAKIAKLQKSVRANAPEHKVLLFSNSNTIPLSSVDAINVFAISEGLNTNERIGTKIKVLSVEVFGQTSEPATVYLARPKLTGTTLSGTDLSSGYIGAFWKEGAAYVYKRMFTGKDVSFVLPGVSSTCLFHMKHNFKGGLNVTYKDAFALDTSVVRNPMNFVVHNHNVINTLSYTYDVKVVYTDA